MEQTPRDIKIQHRFTRSTGLIASREEMVNAERAGIIRTLDRGDIPHMGTFVEAMAKRRYMTLMRDAVNNGKSWSDALDSVRDVAMRRLTDFIQDSDAWERASMHSHKVAAAWFIKETDGM